MKYETLFEEIRVLPKGSIALHFIRKYHCKQTQWNTADVERLSDLSFHYFKKHSYEDSGCISYWVDIHNGGLAVKIKASNTKLRWNRVVQYRMLLRRFAGKCTRDRNERSSNWTHSLPRGLLQSLNKNYRIIPNEEMSEFYVPCTPVRFISVPSTFYLTLDMSSEDRRRIRRQLPENCSVKVPVSPFPAVKIEKAGVGERFIGLLSDEEGVAFYTTFNRANSSNIISPSPFMVYPPLAMEPIIKKAYKYLLQKPFSTGISKKSLEDSIVQLEFKQDEFLSIAKEQNRTSSQHLVPRTPPGSPPWFETLVLQNWKRTSTRMGGRGLKHFIAYVGIGLSTIANLSRDFEPTMKHTYRLSSADESAIEIFRPLLLSKDFASLSGKIYIFAFPPENKQDSPVIAKFHLALPVYRSSKREFFIHYASTINLSFEDLLSIRAILTPDCFPMVIMQKHKIDNKSDQINTLVRSILYILVCSNVGSKVPLSPEERRILGYKSTYLLKSIEYYTVHPSVALSWASILYHEIGFSSFCCGKAGINENSTSFKPVSHACLCSHIYVLLSGITTDENYRMTRWRGMTCCYTRFVPLRVIKELALAHHQLRTVHCCENTLQG